MESGCNRIVCAWCGTILRDGPDVISHSICKRCSTQQKVEMIMETMKITVDEIEEVVARIKHQQEVEWRRQATQ